MLITRRAALAAAVLLMTALAGLPAAVAAQDTFRIPVYRSKEQVAVGRDALPVFEPVKSDPSVSLRANVAPVMSPDVDWSYCATSNTFVRPSAKVDAKAVGAIDCGTGGNKPCYWDKTFILVAFINGTPELKSMVREVAAEWTTWANIGFAFEDNANLKTDTADIKILFTNEQVYWSYVGINAWHPAVRKGKDEPTMKLGYLDRRVRSDDGSVYPLVRSTVLHEFGHAIGLMHEHQNPVGGIRWNRDAVIRDLGGPPANWSVEQVEQHVLKPLPATQTQFSRYDPSSVMHYWIPKGWTLDGIAIEKNLQLSETDKEFIATRYPRKRITVDPTSYFRLSTWYNKGQYCLDLAGSRTDSSNIYTPYFVACNPKSNSQLWRFIPVGNGNYRITNYATGEGLSLADPGVGALPEMQQSGAYAGQYWTTTSYGPFTRLSSVLNGEFYSLGAYTRPDTRPYITRTAHWSNSVWDLAPAGPVR